MKDFTYQLNISVTVKNADRLVIAIGDNPNNIESWYQAFLLLSDTQFLNAKRLLGSSAKIYRQSVGKSYSLHLSERHGKPYYQKLKAKQAKQEKLAQSA